MNRNLLSITAGILLLGFGLSGCSTEPRAQITPKATVTPSQTAEPTETPTGSFQGKCLDIGIEYSFLMETLNNSAKEDEWQSAAYKMAKFFGSDFNAVVIGDDPFESELVKRARGVTGGLQARLKMPYSEFYEISPFLDLVSENYEDFKDICRVEIGEEIWW